MRPLVIPSSLLDPCCLYSICYALHLNEDTRAVETAVQAWTPQHSCKKPEMALCASSSTSGEEEPSGSLEPTGQPVGLHSGVPRLVRDAVSHHETESETFCVLTWPPHIRTHMYIPILSYPRPHSLRSPCFPPQSLRSVLPSISSGLSTWSSELLSVLTPAPELRSLPPLSHRPWAHLFHCLPGSCLSW